MAKMLINAAHKKGTINRNIYGHFSEHLGRCIYEGIYVGENSPIPNKNGMRTDVVEALKNIKIPVLRWPGGCFADTYHWKDGIGPKEQRKRIVNYHWGGVVEDNSFGTHEFMELCEQLGCEPYICGNLGSGTVQEMMEWVEYLTAEEGSPMSDLRVRNGRKEPWKVRFWGVGNENWGCGGEMRPEYFCDVYRRYASYLVNYGDNKLYHIACGPNHEDYEWTETIMKNIKYNMEAISLHYYTYPTPGGWYGKTYALEYTDEEYYKTMVGAVMIEKLLDRHTKIMDRYDPEKKVDLLVDEWGAWHLPEKGTIPGFCYQQSTMRDALVAAVHFDAFNRHCDRVKMANIAQTVNVIQSVILTEGERMTLTPTYHGFDLYKVHQDATLVDSWLEEAPLAEGFEKVPQMTQSVSVDVEGNLQLTISNLSLTESAPVEATVYGEAYSTAEGLLLHADLRAHNTFDEPENVKLAPMQGVALEGDLLRFTLPPVSVARITLKK